ncbi:MAG: DUF5703 domain-containing protein [Planctomycetota bacterium]
MLTLVSLAAAVFASPPLAGSADAPGDYDVVWLSPSADASGSMPLGNGEVAVNAWIEPNGDIVFYLGRTDSWDEHGRLLKIGRIRVHIEPNPLAGGAPFRQTLRLADATLEARAGEGEGTTVLRLWVDARDPVVHVTVDSPLSCTATAALELWRTERAALPSLEVSDVMLDRSRPDSMHAPVIVEPDTVLDGGTDRIGWFHHNARSAGPAVTARIQGLALPADGDPLLGRTFGAVVLADSARRLDERRLLSQTDRRHHFRVYVHTEHPAGPELWRAAIDEIIAGAEARDRQTRRADHDAWWREFWGRSWIHVTRATPAAPPVLVPANDHPVRIGSDQRGENLFGGRLGRVSVLARPLAPLDIANLAQIADQAALPPMEGLLYSGIPAAPLPLPDSAGWSFAGGLTVEALVRPPAEPAGPGRIVDKITPGGSDGFLLDTHPGNGLRLIAGAATLPAALVLSPAEWTHVAGVVDPGAGELRLYANGELVAQRTVEGQDDAFVVSRGYALQRFLTAAAGRGRYPIKFNGSLFTVPHAGAPGDADYRRWGPGYWWQNTRLPYLALCASGDFDLSRPLFRMYAEDLLPRFVARTRVTFGHEGAFLPECIYFWGDVFSETYGWTPLGERGADKLQESGWHKWEWVSGLELVWMMLDWYEHTLDAAFLAKTLLPAAREVLVFFDRHYSTGEDGKLVLHPAQALETWWDCTNPMPELAGLHAVTARLLALPPAPVPPDERIFWQALAVKLPPLPTREENGVAMLAPAARFANKSNIENPELYAVFPFRLVSFEKENAPLGRAALAHRLDRGHAGWRQDDLFMAYLGLAVEARANLAARAREYHAGSRFPAFWGPNYDWVPDQDHGGVLMRTLQAMLLQTEARAIHLLPAWPKDWNASFRLHAPFRTVVEGEVRGGELAGLKVTPPERAADVVVHAAQ